MLIQKFQSFQVKVKIQENMLTKVAQQPIVVISAVISLINNDLKLQTLKTTQIWNSGTSKFRFLEFGNPTYKLETPDKLEFPHVGSFPIIVLVYCSCWHKIAVRVF